MQKNISQICLKCAKFYRYYKKLQLSVCDFVIIDMPKYKKTLANRKEL